MKLDQNAARQADNRSSFINEAGKYTGILTRAEKLTSQNGASGLGLSFKSDSDATANYLDLYTHNAKGETLPSYQTVNALLTCLRLKEVDEGKITVEKWDKEAKETYKVQADGYPAMIGKRIGLVLQKELSTNDRTGADTERMIIYSVFEADTDFMASEILDKATKPEKLSKVVDYIANKPVNDRRKVKSASASSKPAADFDEFEDAPF